MPDSRHSTTAVARASPANCSAAAAATCSGVAAADSAAVARWRTSSRARVACSRSSSSALSSAVAARSAEIGEQRDVAVVEGGGAPGPADGEQPRGLPARGERDERDRREVHAAPQLPLPLVRAAGLDEGLVDRVPPDLADVHRRGLHPADVEPVERRLLLRRVRGDGAPVGRPAVVDLDEARHVGQALVDERADEHLAPPGERRLAVQRGADHGQQPLPLPLADPAVDVEAASDVAADVSLGRSPAVEHPPVVAVGGAQPVLDLERPAVRRRAHPGVVRAVRRVDAVLPGQPQVGVGLGAGELRPAAVDEESPAARPVRPDERRGRVGHRPEAALGLAAGPPERDPAVDAGPQLAGGEGGDQVVVGAGAQPLDGGLGPGPSRHQHHRDEGGARVAAEGREQFEAAQPGKGDVGEDELRRIGHRRRQCGRSVRGGVDAMRTAEEAHEIGAHVGVVVDHQDPARVGVDGRGDRLGVGPRRSRAATTTPPRRTPRAARRGRPGGTASGMPDGT